MTRSTAANRGNALIHHEGADAPASGNSSAACPGCGFDLDARDASDMQRHGLCGQCVTALAGTEGFKHEDLVAAATPAAANILGTARSHLQDRAATYDKREQGGERSIGAAVDAFQAVTGDGAMNTAERGVGSARGGVDSPAPMATEE